MNMPGLGAESSLGPTIGIHGGSTRWQGISRGLMFARSGSGSGSGTERCVYIPIFTTVVRDCGEAGCPAHPGYEIKVEYRPVEAAGSM